MKVPRATRANRDVRGLSVLRAVKVYQSDYLLMRFAQVWSADSDPRCCPTARDLYKPIGMGRRDLHRNAHDDTRAEHVLAAGPPVASRTVAAQQAGISHFVRY